MVGSKGVTLIEIIVVMIILGIAIAFAPSYKTNTEQARALTARNNLLAIYTAEQNYIANNPGNTHPPTYCIAVCDNIADINTNLNLNIQDDGTYSYKCLGSSCTATRLLNNSTLVLSLNNPISLPSGGSQNPKCNLGSWCP